MADVPSRKPKVLFVDDEADITMAYNAILKARGYEVVLAKDGQEALQKAQGELPDVIVLDWMLPKMEGTKVCKLLKAGGKTRGIPVILFTARGAGTDRQLAQEAGADAYVGKTEDSSVVLGKIAEFLMKAGF